MKKSLFLVLAFFVVLLLIAGCGQPAPAPTPEETEEPEEEVVEEIQEMSISIGSAFPEGSEVFNSAVLFKELLEERSEGKISVSLLLAGAAGNEEAVAEAVSIGELEGQCAGVTFLNMFAPEYFFMEVPFAAVDFEHWKNVWESQYGEDLRTSMRERGNTEIVQYIFRGQRFLFAKKPVTAPEDMAGVKIRMPSIRGWIYVWEQGIGAAPIGVPMTEIYTALATGVVDSADGDLSAALGYRYDEVLDYCMLSRHQVMMGYWAFNVDWLNSLNGPTHDMIVQAAIDAGAEITADSLSREPDYLAELEERGVTLVEWTPEQRQVFQDAAEEALIQLYEEDYILTREEVLQFAN
ncbi:MAG: TRAP transporter substrate-binding protein [Bacillota bacterium]|nr:TRAP transporter substrate-binding protein [Bacillota bacterium]